jgi:hypothetical protein
MEMTTPDGNSKEQPLMSAGGTADSTQHRRPDMVWSRGHTPSIGKRRGATRNWTLVQCLVYRAGGVMSAIGTSQTIGNLSGNDRC